MLASECFFRKKLDEVWRVRKEAVGTQQNNTLTFHLNCQEYTG